MDNIDYKPWHLIGKALMFFSGGLIGALILRLLLHHFAS